MSANGVGGLERGYRRAPQRETLALLADALALDEEQREEFEAAAKEGLPRRVRGSVTVGPLADASISNLPVTLTSFIGRQTEIAAVLALIQQHRLVTLVGSGGVGKTRLSLQVAANLLDKYGDGVWFIELAPLTRGDYIPSTVAVALGLTLPPADDPVENLVRTLRGKQTLLIFDNCEHLVGAAAHVISAILHGAPKVTVLASSRQGLGVAGEAIYRVPSLALAAKDEPHLSATDVLRYESVALFVDRAGAARDTFSLTDESAPVVVDICRRLDGIPLAIELAAARVKVLGPKQLHDRLDERFRVLTSGNRDALPRHQTMRVLIDWSYGLLDKRELLLFRRLGIFVKGFTLEGAVAVSGEDFDELRRLRGIGVARRQVAGVS